MQPILNLSVSNLSIERADRLLCDNLSFQVKAGEIWHILGANGVGKSSLLKVLAGHLQPFSGTLCFADEDISLHRDKLQIDLLYLGHLLGIKKIFTPIENLALFYPKASKVKIVDALTQVNLQDYEFVPAYQLSAGQQRRIALAKLWLTDKKVWLLDEPFTSLDAEGVSILEHHIKAHAAAGGIVILTTHQKLGSHLNARELQLSL